MSNTAPTSEQPTPPPTPTAAPDTSTPLLISGTVTFKGSRQRLSDGGWSHMEITLPVGASDAQIAQAISQWDRMEAAGMKALTDAVEWYKR